MLEPDYGILHGRRSFANVIKLRVLRWEDYPGLSGWAQCRHKGSYKSEAEGPESEKEDVSRRVLQKLGKMKKIDYF